MQAAAIHRLCSGRVAGLLCCPFCRELFTEDDAVTRCSDCDVELVPLHVLAPSAESQLELEALAEQTPPVLQSRPLWNMRRSKGLLLLCALFGLASYALPWFSQTSPETRILTGYELARHHVGWLWGGAIGWFILVPLVFTRRSIAALRGVRMIAAVFASMTALEILVFVNMTASRQTQVLVQFAWEWGIWVSSFVSAIGTCAAVTLGGSLPETPQEPTDPSIGAPPRRARNRLLH